MKDKLGFMERIMEITGEEFMVKNVKKAKLKIS